MMNDVKRTAGGAVLLDGIWLRDQTVSKIGETIVAAGSPKICLATVLIGDDPPSHIYVANKHKMAQKAGMVSRGLNLPATATQQQVMQAVEELVADGARPIVQRTVITHDIGARPRVVGLCATTTAATTGILQV